MSHFLHDAANPSDVRAKLSLQKMRHTFQALNASKYLERLQKGQQKGSGRSFHTLWLGMAATVSMTGEIVVAFSSSDGTYNIDFAVCILDAQGNEISSDSRPKGVPNDGGTNSAALNAVSTPVLSEEVGRKLIRYLANAIRQYSQSVCCKYVGVGITRRLAQICPQLAAKLWLELDIVPLVIEQHFEWLQSPSVRNRHRELNVDEEADSMARKCLMYFGPTQQPRIMVGRHNEVEVDAGGHAQLMNQESYRTTVSEKTWNTAMKYAAKLRERNIKIAFFSSTPQGGGVALMRHALIRFFRTVGVDCRWYVPKPKPEVFLVTKTNHNILQGVADSNQHLSEDQKKLLTTWVEGNASRLWLSNDGPLLKEGADVIIVDDPQMPDLVRIAKEQDPGRPVIYRSHIQIRSDLAEKKGTPTSEVWKWLWERIHHADLFISHPIPEFIPNNVPIDQVGLMPATTDWLDGLNKPLTEQDSRYYINLFNTDCYSAGLPTLAYPYRPYIVQIARFDPSKGIPVVLAAYASLRRTFMPDLPSDKTPQLVIAGHTAIDDPEGAVIYDQTLSLLEKEYPDLKEDIVIMRVGPTDQILNTLMRNAHVALQLSTREGFEVKVSEALHRGIPIIASKAGGIPLQVQHGQSGFLVESGEHTEVARYLHQLFSDKDMYKRMSEFARTHVADEVSTVGNALNWMFLAEKLAKGGKVVPRGRWVQDMAMEEAGVMYEGETQLLRTENLNLRS